MPAYRSSDEAEVREAVVARQCEARPDARIIHEINVNGQGSNRIDVMAVSGGEILTVEIKSAKDKLDRLPKQLEAMRACSHHAIAAVHEKFLVEQPTNPYAAHYERDGQLYCKVLPSDWHRMGASETWVFPKVRRALPTASFDDLSSWDVPKRRFNSPLPAGAIGLLWREELFWLCRRLGVAASGRTTMPEMVASLLWHCNGRDLTTGICDALRSRICAEADPEISLAS